MERPCDRCYSSEWAAAIHDAARKEFLCFACWDEARNRQSVTTVEVLALDFDPVKA